MSRDPRIDPQPGDVLKQFLSPSSRSWTERTVRSIAYGGVNYFEYIETWCSMVDWREWSSTTTVVKKAEDSNV